MPFDVVDDPHQKVHVDFGYADESDPGPYPFGPDIHIEGGSDRHALMIDRDTCTLYELYGADWNGGQPTAGSGAIFRSTAPTRTTCGPRRGRRPTRPGCRSSRAWCGGTR